MASHGDEAINLLSFDGGGVRGVSSLVILHDIMKKIQEERGLDELPKPCDFFHMMAGTSTGGLIVIMLGRLRMSTAEALKEYDECAEKIFSKRNKKRWTVTEKFRGTGMQKVIEEIVKKRGLGEMMKESDDPQKGLAFVCVMPASNMGAPRLARTFPSADRWDDDIRIWEAARATTAASSFFKPQVLGRGAFRDHYIDAAIGHNNPVDDLLREAVLKFGADRKFGCMVSIGTGTREKKLGRAVTGFKNLWQAPVYMVDLVKSLKNTATDGEEKHRQVQQRLSLAKDSYFRFNVPGAAEVVGLQEYTKMDELKKMTIEYLGTREATENVQRAASVIGHDSTQHGLALGHTYTVDGTQIVPTKKAKHKGDTTRFFTGREDVLQILDKFFSPRNTGGKPRREFLLYGLGGVGKSQIAFKAADDLEERFRYIFYVDGSSEVAIDQSYANIAQKHNLPSGQDGNVKTLKNIAMEWIANLTEEWLMIFDDLLTDQQGKLPGRGKGNIIYTSRTAEFKKELPDECVFEVKEFAEADAVTLLTNAAGTRVMPGEDPEMTSAKAIVKDLGYLPLAINQAATIMKEQDMTFEKFLDEYRDKRVRLLDNPRFRKDKPESPTVYATLELAYDAIYAIKHQKGRRRKGRIAAAALNVLSLLCFYHHERFPWIALVLAIQERHKHAWDLRFPLSNVTTDPERNPDDLFWIQDDDGKCNMGWFLAGLRLLQKFSLVRLDRDDHISMHILVHTWARHRMDEKTSLQQCLAARILLDECIVPSFKTIDKLHLRALLPHREACFSCRSAELEHDVYEARLSYKRAWIYVAEHRFGDAEVLLREKCLHVFRLEYGNEHWITIDCMLFLAMVYHEMWRLGDAELMYLEAVDRKFQNISDILFEKHGIELSWDGNLYPDRALERLSTRWIFQQLHSAPTTIKKPPSTKAMETVSVKPSTPPVTGDMVATETDDTTTLPAELLDLMSHGNMLHTQLARVYMDQGLRRLGKSMLSDAVKNLEEYVDPESPELLCLQDEVKDLAGQSDMEYWDQRMESIVYPEPSDDPNKSPTVADVWQYENTFRLFELYGAAALVNKHFDLGFEALELALKQYELMYDRRDRRCLGVLRNMAYCEVCRNKPDSAVKLGRICLERSRMGYGTRHPETVLSLRRLAFCIFIRDSEHSEESVALLKEAVGIATWVYGQHHWKTDEIRAQLELARENLQWTINLKTGAGELAVGGKHSHRTLPQLHEEMEETLNRMMARAGEDSPLMQRYKQMLGDGKPANTLEELHRRLDKTFGSDNTLNQHIKQKMEKKALSTVQEEEDAMAYVDAEGYYGSAYDLGSSDHDIQAAEDGGASGTPEEDKTGKWIGKWKGKEREATPLDTRAKEILGIPVITLSEVGENGVARIPLKGKKGKETGSSSKVWGSSWQARSSLQVPDAWQRSRRIQVR
ncbi:hypothetical protein QBC35DRAFT_193056 [Podospora australis]|uniref:PNPLA domain-containing protein n=1 Tax=Podospora australis TaxID=1536484 RepID=A0AAN6WUT3_9PEZI|nr:hypothetical protein QBC35DRAFT_193056 [Podospora australis]